MDIAVKGLRGYGPVPDAVERVAHGTEQVKEHGHLGQRGGRLRVGGQRVAGRAELGQQRSWLARLLHKLLDAVRRLRTDSSARHPPQRKFLALP